MKIKIKKFWNSLKKFLILFFLILVFLFLSNQQKQKKINYITQIIEKNTKAFINLIERKKLNLKKKNKSINFFDVFFWKNLIKKIFIKDLKSQKSLINIGEKIIIKSRIWNHLFNKKNKEYEEKSEIITEYKLFKKHFTKHLENVFKYNEKQKTILKKENWCWDKNYFLVYKKNQEFFKLKEIVFIKKNFNFHNSNSFLTLDQKVLDNYELQQKTDLDIYYKIRLNKKNKYISKIKKNKVSSKLLGNLKIKTTIQKLTPKKRKKKFFHYKWILLIIFLIIFILSMYWYFLF